MASPTASGVVRMPAARPNWESGERTFLQAEPWAMGLTRSTIQRLQLLALMAAASAAVGATYALIRAPDGSPWPKEAATGATIGALIGSSILGFELFAAARLLERDGARLPLAAAVALRGLVYGVAIMAALMFVPWLYSGDELSLARPGLFQHVVFSLAVTFVFLSLTAIVQVIGPAELGNLVTGRYYRPREEERIVAVIDLVDSTGAAERIGAVRFHALLSETFTRLSRVVADHGGEVYRYVGDALIATWRLGAPEENGRAIRCLFACREALEAAGPELLRRHGRVPAFRASLHAGPLVAGEVGGFKREIVLVGDAMNTAARLEQVGREIGLGFVASSQFLARAALPAGIVAPSLGERRLRGKAEPVELFALTRI